MSLQTALYVRTLYIYAYMFVCMLLVSTNKNLSKRPCYHFTQDYTVWICIIYNSLDIYNIIKI